MRWILVLLLVAPKDEIDGLIRALDAPAIEDRDVACAKLLALGCKALGPLRDARECAGTDSQARIDGLLSTIVRMFRRRAGDGGRVLEASASPHVTWDYSRIEDEEGRVVRTERCQVCSPRLVLAHSALAIRPFVKGTFTWFSEYPIAFRDPVDGDRRRIGDFEIVVAWPEIHVVSLRGVRPATLAATCCNVTLFLRKPPETLQYSPDCRFEVDHNVAANEGRWCACDGILNRVADPMSYERHVTIPFSSGVSLEQVDCIRLVFRKPIEEPFEFTGPLIEP